MTSFFASSIPPPQQDESTTSSVSLSSSFASLPSVKSISFSDPLTLAKPENATTTTSSCCCWPVVTLDERRSFALMIQSVSSALTHLGGKKSNANNKKQNNSNNNKNGPLASKNDCSRWCTLNCLPSSSSSSSPLVSIKICQNLDEILQERSSNNNNTNISLPTTKEASRSAMNLCQTMAKIQNFFSTSSSSNNNNTEDTPPLAEEESAPPQSCLVVDIILNSEENVKTNNNIISLFIRRISEGVQRELSGFVGEDSVSSLSPEARRRPPNFSIKFLIASSSSSSLSKSSVSSFITKLVDYFESLVVFVPIIEEGVAAATKLTMSHQDSLLLPETVTLEEDSVDNENDFEDAIVNQISTWYAAKQLSSLNDDDDDDGQNNKSSQETEDLTKNQQDVAVIIVPSSSKSEIAQNILSKLQSGYDTATVNAVIWSRFGKFFVNNNDDTSSAEENNNALSPHPDVFLITAENSYNYEDIISLYEDKKKQSNIRISLFAHEPNSLSAAFFTPSAELLQDDATVARIALKQKIDINNANEASPVNNNNQQDLFQLLAASDLLIKTFASGNNSHTLDLSTSILQSFPSAVKLLLLSGAISIFDPTERLSIFSAMNNKNNYNNNTSSSLLFNFDENENNNNNNNYANNGDSAYYSHRFILNPLGKFMVHFVDRGFGILETRLLVSLSAFGLKKKEIKNLIPQLWARRITMSKKKFGENNKSQQQCLQLLQQTLDGTSLSSIFATTTSTGGGNGNASSSSNHNKNDDNHDSFISSLTTLALTYSSYPLFDAKTQQPILMTNSFFDSSTNTINNTAGGTKSPSSSSEVDHHHQQPLLIHIMISSPLSTRIPLAVDLLEEAKLEREQTAKREHTISSMKNSLSSWSRASCTALLTETPSSQQKTNSASASATGKEQQDENSATLSSSRRAPRTRRGIGGGRTTTSSSSGNFRVKIIDDDDPVAQQRKLKEQQELLKSQQVDESFSFASLTSTSEPWCGIIPDTLSSVGTKGQWFCLPADCSNSLVALKACIRTFMDNALYLFVEDCQQQQQQENHLIKRNNVSLPQLPQNFMEHDAVRKMLMTTTTDDSNNTTTVGYWIQQQLNRNKLQSVNHHNKNSSSSNNKVNTDDYYSKNQNHQSQKQLLSIIHSSCSNALTNRFSAGDRRPQQNDTQQKAPQQQQAPPPTTYAPFVGQLPPQHVRELIDKLAPKVLSQGMEKAKKKLAGNPTTSFADSNSPFHPYFVWAISTFSERNPSQ